MTTPTLTGFKFIYNNVETDFAEVFDITNTGTVTTGYTSGAYGGNDLGKIFKAGINSGITTSYTYSLSNIDLGDIFAVPNIYSQPIITDPPTNVCYKTATISWTNVETPDSYTLTQTETSPGTLTTTYTTTYLSQVVTLINGSTYTFTVTANYSDGTQVISNPLSNYVQPATSTYFTGDFTPTTDVTNTYLQFSTVGSSTLQYNCFNSITTASVLIVGGGGGGAGGGPNSQYNCGGGGGGGGEIMYSSSINFSNGNTATVTVGSNGNGGNEFSFGTVGGSSSVSINSNNYIAIGGSGGSQNSGGGSGGSNGGNGGNGNTTTGSGGSGGPGLNGYSGGGGGGAKGTSPTTGGGLAGNNGSGGSGGSSLTPGPNGQDASYYGGGGGGGQTTSGPGAGGDGYKGVVIFTIPN
jgi:hypothetical protein